MLRSRERRAITIIIIITKVITMTFRCDGVVDCARDAADEEDCGE